MDCHAVKYDVNSIKSYFVLGRNVDELVIGSILSGHPSDGVSASWVLEKEASSIIYYTVMSIEAVI